MYAAVDSGQVAKWRTVTSLAKMRALLAGDPQAREQALVEVSKALDASATAPRATLPRMSLDASLRRAKKASSALVPPREPTYREMLASQKSSEQAPGAKPPPGTSDYRAQLAAALDDLGRR
jgi:hypothetical protein